jgi:hypothetical protein
MIADQEITEEYHYFSVPYEILKDGCTLNEKKEFGIKVIHDIPSDYSLNELKKYIEALYEKNFQKTTIKAVQQEYPSEITKELYEAKFLKYEQFPL